MDEADVARYLQTAFEGVATQDAMGYRFFFYGADRMMPFATLIADDNEHDAVSDLGRPGAYRLNIGVSRATYSALFGPPPSGLGPDGVVETGHDFTTLDAIMPHPVYAPQSWICVLSPSEALWEARVRPLLAEAYARARRREATSGAAATA